MAYRTRLILPTFRRSPETASSLGIRGLLLSARSSLQFAFCCRGYPAYSGIAVFGDFSLLSLAVAGELSLAVESRRIIDQNGLAQGRVRNPRRQQVKEMTVVNPKQ
jgi:hypothetical protein